MSDNKLDRAIKALKSLRVKDVLVVSNADTSALEDIELRITTRLDLEGKAASGLKLRTDTAFSQNRPAYAIRTEQIKGLSNYVNLKQEGEFHDSITAKGNSNGDVIITANFKDIYDNFQIQYGTEKEFEDDIANLNDEELKIWAVEFVLPVIKLVIIRTVKNA